jgi:uncharacterized RDD family membrane protein YckC
MLLCFQKEATLVKKRCKGAEMGTSQMDFQTSEKVQIKFELATVVSRLGAAILDTVFQLVGFYILYFLLMFSLIGFVTASDSINSGFPFAFPIIFIGLILLLFVFYHLIFELLWKGQTPGKKIFRIRVMKDNGSVAGPGALVLRNVLRIVDSLPALNILGIAVLIASEKTQRIGDMAAGTLVVKIPDSRLPDLEIQDGVLDLFEGVDAESVLSADQSQVVLDFLESRNDLARSTRKKLESRLYQLIKDKTGIERGSLSSLEYIKSFAIQLKSSKKQER